MGISSIVIERQRFSPWLADWNTLTPLFSSCPVWWMCLKLYREAGKVDVQLNPLTDTMNQLISLNGKGEGRQL